MAHDTAQEKKSYKVVMWSLFALTCFTLSLGLAPLLDLGPKGVDASDLVLGLSVAAFKASLVALIFMHLKHEKGLIYKMLCFTVIFFLGLMFLTLLQEWDPIREQFDTLITTDGKLTEQVGP